MDRQTAVAAYRRAKEWEKAASARLMVELEKRSGIPGLTPHLLHNWSLCTDQACYSHLPSIKRWHDWAQRNIWDTAQRLETAFARYF